MVELSELANVSTSNPMTTLPMATEVTRTWFVGKYRLAAMSRIASALNVSRAAPSGTASSASVMDMLNVTPCGSGSGSGSGGGSGSGFGAGSGAGSGSCDVIISHPLTSRLAIKTEVHDLPKFCTTETDGNSLSALMGSPTS